MWKKSKITIAIEWEMGADAQPQIRKVSDLKKAVKYATARRAIAVAVESDEGMRRFYISIDGAIPRRELMSAVENTDEKDVPLSTLNRLFNKVVRDEERNVDYIRARSLKDILNLLEQEPYDAIFIKTAQGSYVQIEEDATVVNSVGQIIWPPNPAARPSGCFTL